MSDFDEALARCRKVGAVKASDADAMAGFCDSVVQTLVGAVSPRLVWEGAMKRRMSSREFAELCHRDPLAVEALQWL